MKSFKGQRNLDRNTKLKKVCCLKGLPNLSRRRKDPRFSFDEAFREYDEVRPGYPKELIEDIIQISGIRKGGKILEVGCGTGQATLAFAGLGYSMLCLDIGRKLVEVAREKCQDYPNVELLCRSFEDWEPEKKTFDLLISATAFHWIQPEVGYPKAKEVLKDTGYIALFWNLHPTPYTAFFKDVQRVYRQVVPEWRAPIDTQEFEKTIRERKTFISKTGLFKKVQAKRYPWLKVYSTKQYLKLLNTFSDHRSLEASKRDQLYAGIRNLIEEEYGGSIVRPYLSVLYIAKKNV